MGKGVSLSAREASSCHAAGCRDPWDWAMIFQDKSRERRSDRLMCTISLRVEGATQNGDAFESPGQAIGVNRHGAQIRLDEPIAIGRQVRLTNLENGAQGDFRVIGILSSSEAAGVEFGVEALGDYPTFWGIEFPARSRKPAESRALVECRTCHAVRFMPLSFSEVEVLESGGVLLKVCGACNVDTRWGYAMQVARAGAVAAQGSRDREAPSARPIPGEEKAERPAFVQRPILIRVSSGQIDKAQTESLSKGGLSCSSEKVYEVNQEVTLEWANPGTGLRVQTRGRILRRHDLGGSKRKIYNVRYESSIMALPAARSGPTRKLYLAFSAIVAVAVALTETSVLALTTSVFAPGGSVRRVAYSAGVLLLVCVAYKLWTSILRREPEAQAGLKKKHRVAAALVAAGFAVAVAVGAVRGRNQVTERFEVQRLLRDFAISETLEKNIDAAENRVFTASSDYVDACATLRLLAAQWAGRLDNLSVDAAELSRLRGWHGEKLAKGIKRLQEIISLDRQKIRLIQNQIALEAGAQSISPAKQNAFWQANFEPLRREILNLDVHKDQLSHSRAAEN